MLINGRKGKQKNESIIQQVQKHKESPETNMHTQYDINPD